VNPADINALLVYLEIQARRQGMSEGKVAIAP